MLQQGSVLSPYTFSVIMQLLSTSYRRDLQGEVPLFEMFTDNIVFVGETVLIDSRTARRQHSNGGDERLVEIKQCI